jgi:hypothetical protein
LALAPWDQPPLPLVQWCRQQLLLALWDLLHWHLEQWALRQSRLEPPHLVRSFKRMGLVQ